MKKNSKQKTVYPELGRRVFVGMSGGVDSSVAAALLKKDGFNVVGVHLKCFNVDGCAAEDAEDARRAAEHLGIPFYAFDYEQEYKDLVVKYMVDGYKKGITPNPDVMCNKEIKFGLFYKKALEMGADFVATGHYIRIKNQESRIRNKSRKPQFLIHNSLFVAKDKNKDQSYFLWTLKPEQLSHCLFPIGNYKKPQVRKLAEKFGLHNATKKDSQGICFLGQVSLPDFLAKYVKPKKGPIVIAPALRSFSEGGSETKKSYRIIGTHNGAHFYTIGQRHGLGVGGSDKPLYVANKDMKKNIVVVAEGEDHPALYRKEINLTQVNFFFDPSSLRGAKRRGNLKPITVFARVRYRQPLSKAQLVISNSSLVIKNSKTKLPITNYKLLFYKPIKFVASGQSAVFYDKKGTMLGGGVIVAER